VQLAHGVAHERHLEQSHLEQQRRTRAVGRVCDGGPHYVAAGGAVVGAATQQRTHVNRPPLGLTTGAVSPDKGREVKRTHADTTLHRRLEAGTRAQHTLEHAACVGWSRVTTIGPTHWRALRARVCEASQSH
jgi:hypothetical protein